MESAPAGGRGQVPQEAAKANAREHGGTRKSIVMGGLPRQSDDDHR
jgi:hypothetical protein